MCNCEHIGDCDNQWHSTSRKEQGKINYSIIHILCSTIMHNINLSFISSDHQSIDRSSYINDYNYPLLVLQITDII